MPLPSQSSSWVVGVRVRTSGDCLDIFFYLSAMLVVVRKHKGSFHTISPLIHCTNQTLEWPILFCLLFLNADFEICEFLKYGNDALNRYFSHELNKDFNKINICLKKNCRCSPEDMLYVICNKLILGPLVQLYSTNYAYLFIFSARFFFLYWNSLHYFHHKQCLIQDSP